LAREIRQQLDLLVGERVHLMAIDRQTSRSARSP
jgi:hypothetical protein